MVVSESKANLPWVEKYRPKCLDDLISHKDIINTIQRFISEDRLPHLLFYGPPGTGKTSTILAVAKQLYPDKEFSSMVLELNASDDRGIGIVRGAILSFASTRTIFKSGFKLVILDEADAMTDDAQNALRRVMEKFTENTRFCLICNYLTKIIPALQSRCTRFRFGPLSSDQMMERVEHVIESERVNITDDGRQSLVRLAKGDMRKALNILQSTSLAFDVVNEVNVYLCTGQPLRSDISKIVEWMLNEDFATAYNKLQEDLYEFASAAVNSKREKQGVLIFVRERSGTERVSIATPFLHSEYYDIMKMKTLKGLALQDILTEVHTYVHRVDFPAKVRIYLLEKMADVEHRLASGTVEKIQLGSVIAAFQVARDMVQASD